MEVTYRPAEPGDLEEALRVVQLAYNDLRVRHGLPGNIPLRAPIFQRFCLAQASDGMWIAEAEGRIVGYAFSWICEKFWFLSQLFVRPQTQIKGIGQHLLSKTLAQAERHGADNRALITMAYNPVSIGLYIKNGLFPREPLYRTAAPAAALRNQIKPSDHNAIRIEPSPSHQWIDQMDEATLGFRRTAHHRFQLAGGLGTRAVGIDQGGQPAGYAYISAEGHIGPLAMAPHAEIDRVVRAAVDVALEGSPERVSMIVPGSAERAMAVTAALGFRIEEPYVLMAAHPFGDWRRYLPSNPGYM